MKNRMKWRHLSLPTPKKLRQLGNALFTCAPLLTVSMFAAFPHIHKWIPVASGLLLVLGKFLTMFFAEENENPQE